MNSIQPIFCSHSQEEEEDRGGYFDWDLELDTEFSECDMSPTSLEDSDEAFEAWGARMDAKDRAAGREPINFD